MSNSEKLIALHKKWTKECTCELKKTATQAVPRNGGANAEIVFIGEAPGKKEDETGIPFVGASGKFLDEMLGKIKLKRKDIYITNIVKYRPPNNRDPKPSEKISCRQWLLDELKIIKPKLIVFLGRHAMNDFFPTEQIGKVHGKLLIEILKDMPTKYFYPLYHPAVALYNSSMRKVLLKDFNKIPKILEKIAKDTI